MKLTKLFSKKKETFAGSKIEKMEKNQLAKVTGGAETVPSETNPQESTQGNGGRKSGSIILHDY